MNSIKTKINSYALVNGRAIGQVVLVPESGSFRLYVAWEWENMAEKGFFAIFESLYRVGHGDIEQSVIHTADFGNDITHTDKAKQLFPTFFNGGKK